MNFREVPVFFVGKTPALGDRLKRCFEEIAWDVDTYRVLPVFKLSLSEMRASHFPTKNPALIFIEINEDANAVLKLISELGSYNSQIQLILLADDELDYFQVARNCGIGNVLKKGRFDAPMIRALSIRLLTGNIFGFDPYFPHGFTLGPMGKTYCGEIEIGEVIQDSYDFFVDHVPEVSRSHFRMFIHELLTNTFAYAISGITPEERDRHSAIPPSKIFVPEKRSIKVSLAVDNEKVGVSVQDSSGSLSLLRVLDKLRRQSRIGDEKVPPGLLDETGRGISLLYRYSRLIVNILRGVRTETIFLQYHREELNRFESIIVTEVAPIALTKN